MSEKRIIFVSHRHDDKLVAQALSDELRLWTTGVQPGVKVFQSSDPEWSPVNSGGVINDELLNVLADVDVLLMVYTIPERDWSWVMWEAGVSLYPKANDPNTTIIVFNCLDNIPNPMQNRLSVSINMAEIKKFTVDFHTQVDFFAKHPQAIAPDVGEKVLDRKARDLYRSLSEAVKKIRPQPLQRPEMTPQWIRIMLTLSLTEQILTELRDAAETDAAFELKKDHLKENCLLLPTTDGHALGHFDLARLDEGLKLWDLYKSWRTAKLSAPFSGIDWFSEVGQQMIQIIRNRPAREVTTPLKSAKESDTWYLPVINAARSDYGGCEWEFLLELYRIPSKGSHITISPSEQE